LQATGFHKISKEDHACLGAAITSFSAFEHELLRAIVAMNGADVDLGLSRFIAAPSARLSQLPFESDGTFPAQS